MQALRPLMLFITLTVVPAAAMSQQMLHQGNAAVEQIQIGGAMHRYLYIVDSESKVPVNLHGCSGNHFRLDRTLQPRETLLIAMQAQALRQKIYVYSTGCHDDGYQRLDAIVLIAN